MIVDGQAVNSCLMLAGQADGRQILTIEGLASRDRLHADPEGFENTGALQCGFCGPGVLMSAKALLDDNLNPTTQEIRDALVGQSLPLHRLHQDDRGGAGRRPHAA